MAIEIKRKQNEPLNVFLRRFSEQIKRSGVINNSKEKKFFSKPKSKKAQKSSALMKKERTEKMNFFKKIGKIK
ncbi:MAG: 30S ribosomal protein S21 [Patescibacteria group bacterium]|jgi:ribosomal protein S21|nr:30S ribosomal protein S21 [Patescibacteria group bacterium]MDD5172899.1 30S ribosomal protein S21 [Patescibacteria group bacterium]